jgi:hypothetical protein
MAKCVLDIQLVIDVSILAITIETVMKALKEYQMKNKFLTVVLPSLFLLASCIAKADTHSKKIKKHINFEEITMDVPIVLR